MAPADSPQAWRGDLACKVHRDCGLAPVFAPRPLLMGPKSGTRFYFRIAGALFAVRGTARYDLGRPSPMLRTLSQALRSRLSRTRHRKSKSGHGNPRTAKRERAHETAGGSTGSPTPVRELAEQIRETGAPVRGSRSPVRGTSVPVRELAIRNVGTAYRNAGTRCHVRGFAEEPARPAPFSFFWGKIFTLNVFEHACFQMPQGTLRSVS